MEYSTMNDAQVAHDFCTNLVVALTVDSDEQTAKPGPGRAAVITKRMQWYGGSFENGEDVAYRIASKGVTWCPGFFTPSISGWGECEFVQTLGMDFDHIGGDPKKPAPDPEETLERCRRYGVPVLFWYHTFSATPTNQRHRVVVNFGKLLPLEDARAANRGLRRMFPDADPACINHNLNRLFYGANDRPHFVTSYPTIDPYAIIARELEVEAQEAAEARAKLEAHRSYQGDHSDLPEILRHIPCEQLDRWTWFRVGCGLKWSGMPFELFNDWSATDPERYDGPSVTLRQWQSMDVTKPGCARSGFVVHIARKYGYGGRAA